MWRWALGRGLLVSIAAAFASFAAVSGAFADTIIPGRHEVTISAADYQETKNMEDVGPVLPNTRVLRTTVPM